MTPVFSQMTLMIKLSTSADTHTGPRDTWLPRAFGLTVQRH